MARRAVRRQPIATTFSDLLRDYLADPVNARWLNGHDKIRFQRAFGNRRLGDLTEDRITEYGLDRREKGGEPTSVVNEELRTLGNIFGWAHATGRLSVIPRICYMREEREGPLERRARAGFGRPLFSRGLLAEVWRQRPPESEPAKSKLLAKPEGSSKGWWVTHVEKHPLDKLGADGKPLSRGTRTKLIEAEQHITLHPTTVSRRIAQLRRHPAS